ncbi:histidine kinase [Luteolibacter sp. SL250]|uniref:ATP-binding protein n=1 Tax=Luteolibacter sp. SL250 TaxID=2995170 RepID=UPI00226E3F79|nr:ATP-binding protein [Luteolibacter sp. SL250]WAC18037.1 histidine kinase [Luteolibacter sp. SL250]
MLRLPMVLCCCVWLCAPGWLHAGELTHAEQVRRLTRKESASMKPVRITGVVTYVRGQGAGLVVEDDTGGVMLEWPRIREDESADPSFQVGMKVEVTGRTITSPPTPRIHVQGFRVLGTAPLPAPVEMDLAALRVSELDGSSVQCEDVIRVARIEEDVTPSRLVLELGPASARLMVWISRWDEETRRLLVPGTTVRVRGVLMRWKTVNWLPLVPFVVVNQPDWVTIVEPAPEFGAVPRQPLPEVLPAAADDDFSETIRVGGVVNYADGDTVVIREKEDVLWIRPREAPALVPGDRVEAVGFPGLNGPRGELEDAVVRKTGRAILPPAERMEPEYFLQKEFLWKDGMRVRMKGTVTRGSTEPEGAPLQLLFGSRQIPLYFAERPEDRSLPVAGSIMEATGALEAGLNAHLLRVGRGEADYRLHLQGMEDLKLIQAGPWWTPLRIFAVVGGAAVVAAGAGGWALFLKRRVAEKSRALVHEIAARREQEIVFQERRRLAADLHDTLEQTLTGASLQLEAVGTAEAPRPLALARRLLDRSRDELRRAVWDLTPEVIEERGLAEALEVIAGEQSELGVAVDVTASGDASQVPDRISAHLCRVAQEAISNAVRHGHAERVEVFLMVAEGEVEMVIADDGLGFDIRQAPGISTGHFGINGMKERLRRLGGLLEIRSQPGEGTSIRACCPIASLETVEGNV